VKYPNSIMTVQVKVFISKEAGKYNPDSELLIVPDKIILRPFEMNQTRKSKLVFENDVNWGTFLVPMTIYQERGVNLWKTYFTGMPLSLSLEGTLRQKKKSPQSLSSGMTRPIVKYHCPCESHRPSVKDR
jgi:hypothetical protein